MAGDPQDPTVVGEKFESCIVAQANPDSTDRRLILNCGGTYVVNEITVDHQDFRQGTLYFSDLVVLSRDFFNAITGEGPVLAPPQAEINFIITGGTGGYAAAFGTADAFLDPDTGFFFDTITLGFPLEQYY